MRSNASMPSSASCQGSNTSMRQTGPSSRPCRGVSRRDVHGVWMAPMNTSPASVAGGGSTATSAARSSSSRTMASRARGRLTTRSVHRDHHVGRLDDGVRLLAHGEPELVDGLVRDGCGDGGAVDVETDVRGGGALGDLEDGALEDVACADLHAVPLR